MESPAPYQTEEYLSLANEYGELEAQYDELYNKHQQALLMLTHAKEVIKTMTNFIDAIVEKVN